MTASTQIAARTVGLSKAGFALAPVQLAQLLVVLPIVAGLLYQTYDISMADPRIEASRQLGFPFLVGEGVVIWLAMAAGFRPLDCVRTLSPVMRALLLLFLASFCISSTVLAPDRSGMGMLPLAQNLALIIHLLFACAIAHSLRFRGDADIRLFAHWMGFGALAFAALTAEHFLARALPTPFPEKFVWQFAVPGYISVRLFGAYYGALLVFFAALIVSQSRRGSLHPLYYGWFTLIAAMTLWSGTRAAILGFGTVLPFMALAYGLRPSFGIGLRLGGCLLAGFALALLLIPPGDTQFYLFMLSDFKSADSVSAGRIEIWAAMIRAFPDFPLFGAGPFASGWILADAGQFPHLQPHNFLIEFVASWGLVGAFPALVLLAWSVWSAHRIVLHQPQLVPFLAMLDCLLVMAWVDGTLHFPRHLMLVMVCFGIIFAVGRGPHRSSTTSA